MNGEQSQPTTQDASQLDRIREMALGGTAAMILSAGIVYAVWPNPAAVLLSVAAVAIFNNAAIWVTAHA